MRPIILASVNLEVTGYLNRAMMGLTPPDGVTSPSLMAQLGTLGTSATGTAGTSTTAASGTGCSGTAGVG